EDCWDYNFYRPHSMLGMKTPIEYLQSLTGFENATVDTSVLYVAGSTLQMILCLNNFRHLNQTLLSYCLPKLTQDSWNFRFHIFWYA
ncbi:MAG TPA: hypothetical protein VMR34_04435, partial [Candidatus Saccharimonadales bacterium]|nr:hypothetical protein [Candidatus Saccharimonadales bacterium]